LRADASGCPGSHPQARWRERHARLATPAATTPNATYRNHARMRRRVEILFDPERISYRDLRSSSFRFTTPTDEEPPGQRRRAGSIARRSTTSTTSTPHRRGRRSPMSTPPALPGKVVTEVARRKTVLGGRARAPGLPRALPEWHTRAISSVRAGNCRDVRRSGALSSPREAAGCAGGTINLRVGVASVG